MLHKKSCYVIQGEGVKAYVLEEGLSSHFLNMNEPIHFVSFKF
ncbi:MAG: hypothetical protein K940chlam6_01632 [Chlamydiae bacterium]|nr:hypothetical protein [Chlamydiota bacterium]